MTCTECGKEVLSVRTAAFEITGWEQGRDGGGTNHVLWRERTGKIMCGACVFEKKHVGKIHPEQTTLA